MLLAGLFGLFGSVVYTWFFVWYLGYHGVFMVTFYMLWVLLYSSGWDLYYCWILDCGYFSEFCTWVELGNNIFITINFHIELLSSLVVGIMAGGSLIVGMFVYIEMWDDKEGSSFIILLMLFLVGMGIMVVSGNLVIFYVGWEAIGLTSLFLVTFWSERVRSVKAAFKVFSINKVGDCLLFMFLCLMLGKCGCVDFDFLSSWWIVIGQKYWYLGALKVSLLEALGLLVVVAGGVKSAQFGFHIWLLEAMEAPLGASALMHSSTLVIAGVVLVYKVYGLIELVYAAPVILLIWGSWTALFAAILACWQFELKVILAYSTISSMGFLYMLLGYGALGEVILYLVIHAFVKIFLFLVVGLIITHCNGMQDMRWMGGLLQYIPYGFIFYMWGAFSLAGLPYYGGYYGKFGIWAVVSNSATIVYGCHFCVILSNICTFIYLGRVGVLVFGGCRRGHRSIYRVMQPSGLVLGVLVFLWYVMLYCGVLWVEVISYYIQFSKLSWYHYIMSATHHYGSLTFYGWYVGSLVYIMVTLIWVSLSVIWVSGDMCGVRWLWIIQQWCWVCLYCLLG